MSVTKRVAAQEVGVIIAEACEVCGAKTPPRGPGQLPVIDCQRCGNNLVSFGPPREVWVNVTLEGPSDV